MKSERREQKAHRRIAKQQRRSNIKSLLLGIVAMAKRVT
jgi:hypothetical protein